MFLTTWEVALLFVEKMLMPLVDDLFFSTNADLFWSFTLDGSEDPLVMNWARLMELVKFY